MLTKKELGDSMRRIAEKSEEQELIRAEM